MVSSVSLDSNTWYQLTESRVGLGSALQWDGSNLVMTGQKIGYTGQYWQFHPVGNGYYQIRNLLSSTFLQLATCYSSTEVDASKTKPCMQDARGDASQQWIVQDWGNNDQTFKLVNVGNGTGYNMDCHQGNPLFMNENTAPSPIQPAQHWQVAIISQINNVLYSTTYLDTAPTATTASNGGGATSTNPTTTANDGKGASTVLSQVVLTTQTTVNGQAIPTTITSAIPISTILLNSNSNSGKGGHGDENGNVGNNPGVAIGVGLGVGIFASTIAVLAFLFFMRRRRRRVNQNPIALTSMSELASGPPMPSEKWAEPRHEMFAPLPPDDPNKVRVQGGPLIELPSAGIEVIRGGEHGVQDSFVVEALDDTHIGHRTSIAGTGEPKK